jgi:phosphatidylglycerol:prolipoprotein diacylglycerol transferase
MFPVLFHIGSIPLRSYCVMIVAGFAAAVVLGQVRASRYGLSKRQVRDMLCWALFAGVLGARVGFIAQDIPYFVGHPLETVSLRFEGMTSFGGLIAGTAAIMIWARLHRVHVLRILDVTGPSFILGHAVGRVGCLLNGCCFGVVSPGLPWGIHVEGSAVLHHPAQAYDSILSLTVLAYVLHRESKGSHSGQIFGLSFGLYGLVRFVCEFWRAGTLAQVNANEASSTYWGNLPITQAQALAVVILAVGAVLWARFGGRSEERAEATSRE